MYLWSCKKLRYKINWHVFVMIYTLNIQFYCSAWFWQLVKKFNYMIAILIARFYKNNNNETFQFLSEYLKLSKDLIRTYIIVVIAMMYSQSLILLLQPCSKNKSWFDWCWIKRNVIVFSLQMRSNLLTPNIGNRGWGYRDYHWCVIFVKCMWVGRDREK